MIIKLWFLTYTNYLNRLMSLVSGICVRPGWHPAIEFWYIKFWNLFILFNLYIFGKLFCVNRIAWIFIYVFFIIWFQWEWIFKYWKCIFRSRSTDCLRHDVVRMSCTGPKVDILPMQKGFLYTKAHKYYSYAMHWSASGTNGMKIQHQMRSP